MTIIQRKDYVGFIVSFWFFLILVALQAASIVKAQQFERVKRVIDGDTIMFESGECVRPVGRGIL